MTIACAGGTVVYDSGPDTTHLTSLPLTGKGLQAGASYRARVRYRGQNGCSAFSEWIAFTMAPCADQPGGCPTLPPAPAPAPAPTPVPAQPPGPAGNPQFVLDAANSIVTGDLFCLDNALSLSAIAIQGYKVIGVSGNLILVMQNLGTASGTVHVSVYANETGLSIPSSPQSATIAAGSVGTLAFPMSTDGTVGAFTVNIDTGGGTPYTFVLSATGATDCGT